MRRALIALCVLAAVLECAAGDQWRNMLMARHRAAAATDVGFRVTFLTGTTPTNIVLHASYTGPATPAAALYDAGDGVWRAYTSRTISNVTGYAAFKGNWLNAAGGYEYMFKSAFQSAAYTCKFSGALETTPTAFASCYKEIFQDCTAVKAIEDNPLPILTGTPAASMFRSACYNMTGVTALPTGFLDTSGLTGTPAVSMFNAACYGMSGVTSLPAGFLNTSGLTGTPGAHMFTAACNGMNKVTALPTGFLDTSGLTGTPAASMFNAACYNMSGVTSLPAGFMDTSGLTGAPAAHMFYSACNSMSGVTNAYTFNMSSNITFDSTNVATLAYGFATMPKWGGQVMWGTNVLVEAIPIPSADINTFAGSTNMPNYATINANWK